MRSHITHIAKLIEYIVINIKFFRSQLNKQTNKTCFINVFHDNGRIYCVMHCHKMYVINISMMLRL